MKKNIINLEINEIPPILLEEYIENNQHSYLAKLFQNNLLDIYETQASDIEKDKLYPSQTWASFNTGKSFDEHKCYWYSDNIQSDDLLWNKLVSKDISVGVFGSIHSSKYPLDLITNKKYKFYLPDCFSSKNLTKPFIYSDFQELNNSLVAESGRVTGVSRLLKLLINYFFKIFIKPRKFGLNFFSFKLICLILFNSLRSKNKEYLRMAQFPLMAAIYCDLYIKYKPQYSTLFSNHIAGNMHRYWYAHEIESFKNKKKYSKSWIIKNKRIINLSIDLVDYYVGFLLKRKEFENSIILITSSMGQEPNPTFDSKKLAHYDGKITNLKVFLRKLKEHQEKYFGFSVDFKCYRNMAPQYGFTITNSDISLEIVSKSIKNFLLKLGLEFKLDVEGNSIVLTVDPYTDNNLQRYYSLKQAKKKYSSFGFDFFAIEDHHSGSHCENGSFAVINPSKNFKKLTRNYIDEKGKINYLDFTKIILNYFSK